jgi:hypothetical protein
MIPIYDWQPGNGTNYKIAATLIEAAGKDHPYSSDRWLLCWMKHGGSGGVCMMFEPASYLSYNYMAEKMRLGSMADVAALLAFVDERKMATVGMPPGFGSDGLRIQETA